MNAILSFYLLLNDLGVAGWPLLPALSELPILSIQVPQLYSFPPYTKPVSRFTPISLSKPENKNNS